MYLSIKCEDGGRLFSACGWCETSNDFEIIKPWRILCSTQLTRSFSTAVFWTVKKKSRAHTAERIWRYRRKILLGRRAFSATRVTVSSRSTGMSEPSITRSDSVVETGRHLNVFICGLAQTVRSGGGLRPQLALSNASRMATIFFA